MNTKKILIFTDWYAPAYKAGGPISSIVNLVNLLQKDFNFYIVTGDRDLGNSKPFQNIEPNTWIKGENGENIWYFKNASTDKKALNNIVEVIQPNYIYYNSLFSANFTLKPLLFLRKKGVKSFLSPRGMLHPKAFSQKGMKKQLFVALSKLWSPFKKLIFLATNKTELEHIKRAGYKNIVIVAPNIPDIRFFDLDLKTNKANIITVVSRIAKEKNSLGAIEVLSKLKENVTCNWFGEANDQHFEAKFQSAINNLPSNINIVLHGAQNKNEIKKEMSGIFFLPTFGENFGHAIFEALAAGLPAVIGSNTPFADLESFEAGFAIDPKNASLMAEKLSSLLILTPDEFTKVSASARSYAKTFFNQQESQKVYSSFWN